MDNYIVINGRKAELTEDQLKALGIELPKKNSFEKDFQNNQFYYIDIAGNVCLRTLKQSHIKIDACHAVANYCTDKSIMEQRALHETLNRLLWRYSMEHDGDKIDWSKGTQSKYKIYYNVDYNSWGICDDHFLAEEGVIYFFTSEIAKAAIEEIAIPFMKRHSDFKW